MAPLALTRFGGVPTARMLEHELRELAPLNSPAPKIFSGGNVWPTTRAAAVNGACKMLSRSLSTSMQVGGSSGSGLWGTR
jgi:hypothetical protein